MPGVSERRFAEHKVRNFLHSLILVASMVVLLCFVGYLVAGWTGLVMLGAFWFTTFLVSSRLSPYLLLRLYRARPLTPHEAPALTEIVAELSRRAGLPCVPTLYYVPSRIVNAFSVGTCDSAAIGVTDGLLRNLNLRELAGVLAHEVSHIAKNDVWVMGLADLVTRMTHFFSWIGQLLLFINLPLLLLSDYNFPWLLVFILIFAPTLSALLQLALSRTREFEADLDAARLTGDPRGLASALRKLEALSGNFLERIFLPGRRQPEPSLFRTHPPTEERIKRLLELEEPAGEPLPTALADEGSFLPSVHAHRELRLPSWHVTGLWY